MLIFILSFGDIIDANRHAQGLSYVNRNKLYINIYIKIEKLKHNENEVPGASRKCNILRRLGYYSL